MLSPGSRCDQVESSAPKQKNTAPTALAGSSVTIKGDTRDVGTNAAPPCETKAGDAAAEAARAAFQGLQASVAENAQVGARFVLRKLESPKSYKASLPTYPGMALQPSNHIHDIDTERARNYETPSSGRGSLFVFHESRGRNNWTFLIAGPFCIARCRCPPYGPTWGVSSPDIAPGVPEFRTPT